MHALAWMHTLVHVQRWCACGRKLDPDPHICGRKREMYTGGHAEVGALCKQGASFARLHGRAFTLCARSPCGKL